MKKLLLISILLGSIILAGCGQKQWLSQDELFSKKQECAKYKNNIENIIQNKCEEHKIPNIENMNCYLDEIYFNSKSNSCEYSRYWNYNSFTNWKITENDASERRYYVYDYLSSKEIFSYVCDKSDSECNKMAKDTIKEIKWE